ncbi:adenylyltransferase [Chloroflexia bacterium SDU3-3]|nr:adenylyltransferase [Chloroflexia bacterium SDU3-3]
MHPDLVDGFSRMIEVIKADPRCKGGWHYGSISHGASDQYSDYDPVFLVPQRHFEAFSLDVARFVRHACDELLICWAEDYNSAYFKNFCNLIRIKQNLHQLDFFILNEDHVENWWCRQHLKGCTREHIIYDASGDVAALLDRGLRTESALPDPQRCFDTYWFHAEMQVKYFKRGDIFKIIKNMDFLFHAHVDLLLTAYDTLDWGAWETKVRQCVPHEKQRHLLGYFTTPDAAAYAAAISAGMRTFNQDAVEIFGQRGLDYPQHIADQVIGYFSREVGG